MRRRAPPHDRTSRPLAQTSSVAVLGKAEGEGKNWHGHVTAVTVAPEYRRLGLARQLMNFLEDVTEYSCATRRLGPPAALTSAHCRPASYNGFFVDLYVRVSNAVAINMYRKLGYNVYRRVLGYYSGEEDAYGGSPLTARRSLPRVTTTPPVRPSALPLPVQTCTKRVRGTWREQAWSRSRSPCPPARCPDRSSSRCAVGL